jgi:predicted O-methyltransferase YrrM
LPSRISSRPRAAPRATQFDNASHGKSSLGQVHYEKKILAVLEDLARNQRSRLTVPVEDARLLRLLTESIHAKHVVELGTANGYSGIWFALALQTTGGKLTTFEIDPDSVKHGARKLQTRRCRALDHPG